MNYRKWRVGDRLYYNVEGYNWHRKVTGYGPEHIYQTRYDSITDFWKDSAVDEHSDFFTKLTQFIYNIPPPSI